MRQQRLLEHEEYVARQFKGGNVWRIQAREVFIPVVIRIKLAQSS